MSQHRKSLLPSRPYAWHPGHLLVCALALTGGCGPGEMSDLYSQARRAADSGDEARARELSAAIPRGHAAWSDSQLLLGELEAASRGPEAGMPYFAAIPRDGSPASLRAALAIAEIQFRNGALSLAAPNYEYVLQRHPETTRIQLQLADIQLRCGQRTRAELHLMEVLKRGEIEIKDLVALTEPDRSLDPSPLLQRSFAMSPDDPFVSLGLALQEFNALDFAEAKVKVSPVVQSHPEFAEAQALLGELTLDGSLEELAAWHRNLPDSVRRHGAIWYVRGLWARRIGQPAVAARCFWETVRQFPTHRRAIYQLGQVLRPLDKSASEAFSRRAAELTEYSELLEEVLISHGTEQEKFQRMIGLLIETGREWEAWAWVISVRELMKPTAWLIEFQKVLSHVPAANPPRFREDKDVALLHNLSHYPDFQLPQSDSDVNRRLRPVHGAPVRIQFIDQAAELGMRFTYYQSPDSRNRAVRIFESTGGGIGILDFDLDGRPDLFLTQGEEWPRGADQPVPSGQYRDRLYRNAAAGFLEITEAAGLGCEEGFGQGCSCGDFNNDGFTDLYVGNIGGNQLLLNNGDGTFSDVTRDAGITGSAWTTSCLILDLNADGSPDLYDVNYLQGEKIFSVECGEHRCTVRNYRGAPDQVLLSQGDGTFAVIPDATPRENDKGLGIVAFFENDQLRPSLFIANDQVPNFLLRPAMAAAAWTDEALQAGLAVNRNGQPTACMGVAAGDLNHDRRIDLFVTNFEGEANNLYLQRDPGFFEDAIAGTGLMEPGIPYVSWGTQLLDADNDGESDLVVANGHIADFGEPGVTYHMPTQFFRNTGRGSFLLSSPTDLGPLFERNCLGRSLATMDWNQDGRMDFVLSSIESPVVLATNQTGNAGHWLDVRLHARSTARDAIGAVVEIQQGATLHWQQLLAGDGFQASNERKLHFGLGAIDTIDRVSIRWPSGATESFTSVPIDATIEFSEGRKLATLMRDGEVQSWP